MEKVEVFVGCIYIVVDIVVDLYYVVCGMIQQIVVGDGELFKVFGIVFKLSVMSGVICTVVFKLGEYIDEVLVSFGLFVVQIVVLCEK